MLASFTRANAEYQDDESLGDVQLARSLNRREDITKVQLRYELTPLTTFVVDTDFGRDRFNNTDLRNADGLRVFDVTSIPSIDCMDADDARARVANAGFEASIAPGKFDSDCKEGEAFTTSPSVGFSSSSLKSEPFEMRM